MAFKNFMLLCCPRTRVKFKVKNAAMLLTTKYHEKQISEMKSSFSLHVLFFRQCIPISSSPPQYNSFVKSHFSAQLFLNSLNFTELLVHGEILETGI